MLHQGLSQKLLQKLSPQQIQLMKLLQVPTSQLEERIKEEIEQNPALELSDESDDFSDDLTASQEAEEFEPEIESEGEDDFSEGEETPQLDDELDMSDFYDEADEGMADYKTKDSNEFADPDDDNKTIPIVTRTTFHEYLDEQVGMLDLEDNQHDIALHLVGSIDDDGYLRRDLDAIVDDLAFRQSIYTTPKELEAILKQIQTFDPAGVGARSLEECLLIQLERKEEPTKYTEIAKRVLTNYFESFVKKHYDKLERSLGISSAELKKVIDEITKLNPRPGGTYVGTQTHEQTIVPDFIITTSNGELILTLNSANAPELRVSQSFKEMVTDFKKSKIKSKDTKDALLFIKQKIESAKWFIDAIKKRQNTLYSTMQSIMEIQFEFFTTGDETQLKPMILKDIADKTGLDISTISRVASSKYVQTEYGTFLLKFFFSESLSTESGEEVSTREVKKILTDLISGEDKSDPISDQELTNELNKKGYNIARRTVAKYREQMNIPVARLRKEL
jgi:RNA polymerase sigma-54 factor